MPETLTDWRTIINDREKYKAYLCSREWGLLKKAVHQRCNGTCERCHRDSVQSVHHLTYERKYNERLEDLQGLCNGCHQFIHGHSDFDPLAYFKEPERTFQIVSNDTIQCPKCCSEHSNVHMRCMKVEQGKTRTIITNESTQVVPVADLKGRRGSRVVFFFACECGGSFAWDMVFHKGATQFEVINTEKIKFDNSQELWRD